MGDSHLCGGELVKVKYGKNFLDRYEIQAPIGYMNPHDYMDEIPKNMQYYMLNVNPGKTRELTLCYIADGGGGEGGEAAGCRASRGSVWNPSDSKLPSARPGLLLRPRAGPQTLANSPKDCLKAFAVFLPREARQGNPAGAAAGCQPDQSPLPYLIPDLKSAE